MSTRPFRAGRATLLVVVSLAAAAFIGGGWWLFRDSAGGAENTGERDLYTVARGRFDVVIPSSGELQALKQIEISNKLESRAVLMEIVPEGTIVKPGEILFRIADDEIRNKIKDSEDAVKTAEAALIAAETTLRVKESAAASEEDKAKLAERLAKLALESWSEGEEKVKRENLEVAKRTAEINFERLKKKHDESKKLHADGHISFDELEQDRIAMIESEAKVKTGSLELKVYLGYTLQQDEAKKRSDLEQAEAEYGRVQQRNAAEIGNAKAAVESAAYKLSSAQQRLADFNVQLAYCKVLAPSAGLVVYATSLESNRWGGGGSERTLQVGSELSPNQPVILLPDTSQMVASVKVNEALSGRIRAGQRAVITSDALPDQPLDGEVLSVGVLAESSGWRDPNRRDYTVRVLLRDATPEMGLKPSMRCKAEIIVESVDDALHVPIQAVFRRGGTAFVYAVEGDRFGQRDVRTGRASELDVEILSGLTEGERVLLREPEGDEIDGAVAGDGSRNGAGGAGGGPGGGEAKPGPRPEGGKPRGPKQEIAGAPAKPAAAGM